MSLLAGLDAHAQRLAGTSLASLIEDDPARARDFSLRVGPLYANFARQRYDRLALDALFEIADRRGLAAAMRSDASTAASAFNVAADGGCALPVPGSLHGLIPARELGPVLEALRGLARHKPKPEAPPVPIHA